MTYDKNREVETPPELARRMARLVGAAPGRLILEPSAGWGCLANAILNGQGSIWCVTIDPAHEAELTKVVQAGISDRAMARRHKDFVWINDFAVWAKSFTPDKFLFHGVCMHPPAGDGDDVVHTKLGYRYLRPFGRLVSLIDESSFAKKPFAKWLTEVEAEIEPLSAEVFGTLGGTIRRRLVVIERGSGQPT